MPITFSLLATTATTQSAIDSWDHRMVDIAVDIGLFVVFAGFIFCLIRVVRGPHLADRAIALDTIAIHVIAFVILLTLRLDSLVMFDGALVMSLLGFAGTIAAAQFITRSILARERAEAEQKAARTETTTRPSQEQRP